MKIKHWERPDVYVSFGDYLTNHLPRWLNKKIDGNNWTHNYFEPVSARDHGIFFNNDQDKTLFLLCWGHLCQKNQ